METDQINQQKRPRIVWIDIMRGLLMFWVIFGHITEDPDQINYIYSFHMPAYFFLTGMTFAFRKDRRTWPFIFDKVFGLLVHGKNTKYAYFLRKQTFQACLFPAAYNRYVGHI